MEQEQLRELESHCIQEHAPTCAAECPAHVDARAICAAIAGGDYASALKTYRRAVPFPGIISRVCDQPCRAACLRSQAGDAIEIASLEKACVKLAGPGENVAVLPRRGRRAGVVGGGLSGLTAAFDLAKKGYGVVIFEKNGQLGGSLWDIPRDALPADVITADLAVLNGMGVEVQLNTLVELIESKEGRPPFIILGQEFDSVYVGTGAGSRAITGLETDLSGSVTVDSLTYQTNCEGIFAGGGLVARGAVQVSEPPFRMERSAIVALSQGRRAAVSMDRFLQRVSLSAARVNEGPYSTRLYTSLEGISPLGVVRAEDSREGYSSAEAQQEAQRCIRCECMECVKVCEYLKQYGSYPKRYVREIYNNLSIVSGERQKNKFINSCSLCGLCAEVCPEDLNMGNVCLEARRLMFKQDRMPPSAHDFALRDMAFSNSEKFAMARSQPGKMVSTRLFFPGCQLAGSSPQSVEKTYSLLCKEADRRGDGGVGLMLRCCGAPAEWAGRSDLFEASQAEFLEEYRKLGEPELILACSSCFHIFKTYYPQVKISSLWTALDGIENLPGLQGGSGKTLAIHDPCTTRYETEIQDSARSLLQKMGYKVEELPLTREETECCSYGGVMWLANKELARDTVRRRIQVSEQDYVTYCAMCRDFFSREGKPSLHLLDLVFYPDEADELASRRGPDYSARHENRARLKKKLLKEAWNEEMDMEKSSEMVKLIIDEPVRLVLDERLILVEDIQQVISHSERTGLRLLNRQTGRYLANFTPGVVTYWVEYTPEGNGFVVYNAYSHRMVIETGVQK